MKCFNRNITSTLHQYYIKITSTLHQHITSTLHQHITSTLHQRITSTLHQNYINTKLPILQAPEIRSSLEFYLFLIVGKLASLNRVLNILSSTSG